MIKDELEEFVVYNEIISNLSLSGVVFIVFTFAKCIMNGTLSPDLTVPFVFGFSTLIILTVIDYIKR